MRNREAHNGEVKEEEQEGSDEEEPYRAARNFTFAPPPVNGDANNPSPPLNMEDDFLDNIWADGGAHTLTNAISPPRAVAAQNGRLNEEEWAESDADGGTCVDNPEVTLEDFLQKAGVLPPGPTISNRPAFQPYRPPQNPPPNLGPPDAEMVGRLSPISNGPPIQPPYGPSRVPYLGPVAGRGPLLEVRDLNLAGVGYGGRTTAASNAGGGVYCPYDGGSIGVGAGRGGFGAFACDPAVVAGLGMGSSMVVGPAEGIAGSGDRGKRPAYEPEEVVAERRTRRKVKNRESAARSRARKHAYVITMEAERDRLQGENSRLRLQERLLKVQPEEAGPSTIRRCKSCSW